MATIEISRSHALSKDAARAKAEDLARDMKEKMGIDWSWGGDRISFDARSGAAKGTTGYVEVTDSAVKVAIDLPFLLRAMKGTIEGKVRDKLDKVLG